jgi:hypothetical protein
MLRARDFGGLAKRIEEAERRVETDARREPDLVRVLAAFDSGDPALTPLLDAWVAASPDAWTARLARATHFVTVAWRRRGSKVGRETTEEQHAQMQDFLRKVVEDAKVVLKQNPKVGAAYRLLISAAMGIGDNRACIALAAQGIAVSPASLRVRTRLATCLLPRWGGSYDALAGSIR